MSKTINLNNKFLKFSWPRRLWYCLTHKSLERKSAIRLKKRGVENPDLKDFSPEEKIEIAENITTNYPQSALIRLNNEGVQVNFVDFSLSEAYNVKRFPLFRAALASACWDWTDGEGEGLGDAVKVGIMHSIDFNITGEIESEAAGTAAEILLRTLFCVGGVIGLDAVLLPHLISRSDLLLSSDYFDYFEWMPLFLDFAAGVGMWGKRSKSKILKKIEPYPLPIPPLGYWAGRFLKKALHIISFSVFWGFISGIALPFKTLLGYARLRSYELFEWKLEKRANAILGDLKDWALQKALIERWIRKGKVAQAQIFFNELISEAWAWDGKHHDYQLKSLGLETIEKLLPGLSKENLSMVLSEIEEKDKIKIFKNLTNDIGQMIKLLILPGFEKSAIRLFDGFELKYVAQLLEAMPDQETAKFLDIMDPEKVRELLPLMDRNKAKNSLLLLDSESKARDLMRIIYPKDPGRYAAHEIVFDMLWLMRPRKQK
ncbi:hypothetical protein AMJ44_12195 [candidate division WOR-1 bacterium DG_54_3]|uniref:Magnesium transporter MgtE intracellular domain-containing protein n=1 Tax=candidate division WOR-1 bacterium DG_54_3 TaxID=1703775 RepID=A0A0S7XR51_UNCSA|nr:MAG: hypothetical protein AMJ44_12195 [candidate division WOR-1 bacterium DG_54_3]